MNWEAFCYQSKTSSRHDSTLASSAQGGRFTPHQTLGLFQEMQGGDDGIDVDEATFGKLCMQKRIYLKEASDEIDTGEDKAEAVCKREFINIARDIENPLK